MMAVSKNDAGALALKAAPKTLSPREKTVLAHLSDGLHVDAIAERMSVSETSVKALVAQAMGKLEARSRVHAVALAVRRRLI